MATAYEMGSARSYYGMSESLPYEQVGAGEERLFGHRRSRLMAILDAQIVFWLSDGRRRLGGRVRSAHLCLGGRRRRTRIYART